MPARICVSIRESTTEEAAAACLHAARWADLVEIRGDFIHDLDPALLLREKPCPVLFTLRSRREGGDFDGPERLRLGTIIEAARAGADYVDVEYSAFWKPVFEAVPRDRIVISSHNLENTPESLNPLLEAMAATGAGIIKIATRARRLSDNLRIAELLSAASKRNVNLCALAMGREGIPSRILGPRWGSWMTFASLPGGKATADGQIPADIMVEQYQVRRLSPEWLVYGVVGRPLEHSLSPLIHNAVFGERGVKAVYLPLEADGFDDFLQVQDAIPVEGASITIPFKEDACAHTQSLSVQAEQTGAVNTIVRRNAGWHGENTDVDGFLRPLRRRVHPGHLRAVVLGAGGAARSVVYALRSQGTEVCVVARDGAKARRLAAQFQADDATWDWLPALEWDLLVNATPVGMFPEVDRSPVPPELLHGGWVYDLVYNPAETRLLRTALERGCKVIPGVEMFLEQARRQQILWCRTPPPENLMAQVLQEALASG